MRRVVVVVMGKGGGGEARWAVGVNLPQTRSSEAPFL